jgi:hypothetical protein
MNYFVSLVVVCLCVSVCVWVINNKREKKRFSLSNNKFSLNSLFSAVNGSSYIYKKNKQLMVILWPFHKISFKIDITRFNRLDDGVAVVVVAKMTVVIILDYVVVPVSNL